MKLKKIEVSGLDTTYVLFWYNFGVQFS